VRQYNGSDALQAAMLEFMPFNLPFALLGIFLALTGGIALGAWAGAQTRPLVRSATWPVAAGVGTGVGLVAAIGAVVLTFALLYARLNFLPIGWLAAGVLFGVVVALVTIDWAGAALAGATVTALALSAAGAVAISVNIFYLLRFIPPFLLRFLQPILSLVIGSLTSLVPLAGLLLIALLAALAARLVNQFLGGSDGDGAGVTAAPPPSTGPSTINVE
jgi:hypothetical protein